MAQGNLKKPKSLLASRPQGIQKPRPKDKSLKRQGGRYIPPRQLKMIEQAKLRRKLSAGLTAQTEQNLGEKVGHLELVNQNKKMNKKERKKIKKVEKKKKEIVKRRERAILKAKARGASEIQVGNGVEEISSSVGKRDSEV